MFELTNEQRKCFALAMVQPNWERIKIKAGPYDTFETYVYCENNIIKKCVITSDLEYCEYELSETISNDGKYLLPKTSKGKPALLRHIAFQRFALYIFHNDIFHVGINGDVVNIYDVFMRKHGNRLGFINKAGLCLLVAVIFIVQDLDGNHTVHHKILGAQNASHAANAHEIKDLIPFVKNFSDKIAVIVHAIQPFLVFNPSPKGLP